MYIISKRKKSFQFLTVCNKLKKSMLIENKTTGGKPLENNQLTYKKKCFYIIYNSTLIVIYFEFLNKTEHSDIIFIVLSNL